MDGVDHHRFAGKPCPRPQQPFQLAALAQILIAAQRGDHLLTDLPTVTATFNDLEIGASARGLLAEIHRRILCGEHKIAGESASINMNKHKTWHYVFAQTHPSTSVITRVYSQPTLTTVEDQFDGAGGAIMRLRPVLSRPVNIVHLPARNVEV